MLVLEDGTNSIGNHYAPVRHIHLIIARGPITHILQALQQQRECNIEVAVGQQVPRWKLAFIASEVRVGNIIIALILIQVIDLQWIFFVVRLVPNVRQWLFRHYAVLRHDWIVSFLGEFNHLPQQQCCSTKTSVHFSPLNLLEADQQRFCCREHFLSKNFLLFLWRDCPF